MTNKNFFTSKENVDLKQEIHVVIQSFRLLYKNVKIKIYEIIISPVVLYGYKTWSLTLGGECRLRVFKNVS